jgi:hypothetical protein
LKDTNGPNPIYGKEEKNSTLREKLLWRNYSLHIESASLCSTPKFFPTCLITSLSLLYELAFGGGLKWWRLIWKELSFSVLNHADTKFCNSFTFVDYILIEILFSRPVNILQIFELLFHGRIFYEC